MKKCIIYGAGEQCRLQLYKISLFFEIDCIVDRDKSKFGITIGEYKVEPLSALENRTRYDIVIVTTTAYRAVEEHLSSIGITNTLIMLDGMFYEFGKDDELIPRSFEHTEFMYEPEQDKHCILFLQSSPCIRTLKIADLMKNKGWNVSLLYITEPDINVSTSSGSHLYQEIFSSASTVSSIKDVIEFIDKNSADVVHCSNAPDFLVNIAMKSKKPVVHDVHDMESMEQECISYERLIMEYSANIYSDGVIHVTNKFSQIAERMYGSRKNVMIFPNLISEKLMSDKNKEKLRKRDKEYHCVYEGVMNFTDSSSPRYFNVIFERFIRSGIHIHIYTMSDCSRCIEFVSNSPYLHYEGNLDSKSLAVEMSAYDCGLAIFNIDGPLRKAYQHSSPNKVYEYLNAGIPVIVSPEVDAARELLEMYDVGVAWDPTIDPLELVKSATDKTIESDFLKRHFLTMESRADELSEFYWKVITEHEKKNS